MSLRAISSLALKEVISLARKQNSLPGSCGAVCFLAFFSVGNDTTARFTKIVVYRHERQPTACRGMSVRG